MIVARELTCSYRRVILDHLNFEVPAGKITALIGANGSGKSTLVQAVAGIRKFRGELQVDDLEVTKRTPARVWRQAIGIVFQNPDHQILFSRVYDDLEFILANLHWPVSERAGLIQDALSAVGLSEQLHVNPRELSGGQKQRLAIASALLTHPRYLILDEATSMLDLASRQRVYQILHQLAGQGVGILLATNLLDELLLADEVLVLHQARIHPHRQAELIYHPQLLQHYELQPSFILRLARKYRAQNWQELAARLDLDLPETASGED